MVLLIFSTNVTNMLFWLKAFLRRCCDRSCTCDRRNTKTLSQRDYNDMNTGPELDMDYKYANILVVVWMTMTYGSGIPIMYLIACVYFFVSYWSDKMLIFYNYRKPIHFDEKMAMRTLWWFKLAIVFHLIVGVLMLSNSHILPTKEEHSDIDYADDNINSYLTSYSFGNTGTVHMAFFILITGGIIVVYIVWRLIVHNCYMCFRRVWNKDNTNWTEELQDNNIYGVFQNAQHLRDLKAEAEQDLARLNKGLDKKRDQLKYS